MEEKKKRMQQGGFSPALCRFPEQPELVAGKQTGITPMCSETKLQEGLFQPQVAVLLL